MGDIGIDCKDFLLKITSIKIVNITAIIIIINIITASLKILLSLINTL